MDCLNGLWGANDIRGSSGEYMEGTVHIIIRLLYNVLCGIGPFNGPIYSDLRQGHGEILESVTQPV